MQTNLIPLQGGKIYTTIFYMRAAAPGAQVFISLNIGAPSYATLASNTISPTTTYARYTFRVTAPAAGGSYRLHMDFAAAPCEVYVDEVVTTLE